MDRRVLMIGVVLTALPACVTQTSVVGQQGTAHEVSSPDLKAAAKTRLELGLEYLRKGNAEQAKFNLDRAQGYDPDNPDIYLGYAYFYQSVRDDSAAERAYRKVLELSPQHGDAMNNYGAFLCSRGRYDEADRMFNLAVAQPHYAKLSDTYENAALCATQSGKKDKASEYYRLALGYNPRKPGLLLDLTAAALERGETLQAGSYLSRFSEVSSETAESLWLRLRLAQVLDKPAQLHQYGSQLVELFPNSQQAKRYLANDY